MVFLQVQFISFVKKVATKNVTNFNFFKVFLAKQELYILIQSSQFKLVNKIKRKLRFFSFKRQFQGFFWTNSTENLNKNLIDREQMIRVALNEITKFDFKNLPDFPLFLDSRKSSHRCKT